MSHDSESAGSKQPKRRGLFSRHPRLGILVIGALFLIPICVMVGIVAVIILNRM